MIACAAFGIQVQFVHMFADVSMNMKVLGSVVQD
jgi:hypothetical protein